MTPEERYDRIDSILDRVGQRLDVMAARQQYHDEAHERHDAAIKEHDDAIKELVAAVAIDAEHIRALVRIAELHDRRLEDLE